MEKKIVIKLAVIRGGKKYDYDSRTKDYDRFYG